MIGQEFFYFIKKVWRKIYETQKDFGIDAGNDTDGNNNGWLWRQRGW